MILFELSIAEPRYSLLDIVNFFVEVVFSIALGWLLISAIHLAIDGIFSVDFEFFSELLESDISRLTEVINVIIISFAYIFDFNVLDQRL
jgi:uncharacterized membrane protein (Fun14 family)